MTHSSPESTPTRPVNGSMVPVREYFEALRAADEKLRVELAIARKELEAERDRRYQEKDVERAKALEVALEVLDRFNQAAVTAVKAARDVDAATYKADKAAANEWRGTVQDIISKMGGAKVIWIALLAAGGLALAVMNYLSKASK